MRVQGAYSLYMALKCVKLSVSVVSLACFFSPGLLFIQLDIFSMNGEVLFFGNVVRTAAC